MTTSTVVTTDGARLFRYAPPVGPATIAGWQAELERVVPRTDRLSWLYLRWEPGDVWEPVQRWVLWQVWPADVTAALMPQQWAALHGPSPRSKGRFSAERRRWVGGATPWLSRQQWEIGQEIGRYAEPWWVVQGPNGGHRIRLSDAEKQMRKMQGRIDAWPRMGALPYAPFDTRVTRWVRQYDLLQRWTALRGFDQRTGDDVMRELEADSRRAAELQLAWLDEQVAETVDEGGGAFRALWDAQRPVGLSKRGVDADASNARFVDDLTDIVA